VGLDWIVLAKEQDGVEINPTDVIGSRRATRDDPEVLSELRRIWAAGDQANTFDQFVDELVSRDVPPVVILYGKGFEAAIPAVQAEVQFYGFRGKAIEPNRNRVSAFAERNGHDISWLYGEFATQTDIEKAINLLQRILSDYRREAVEITSLAERYYGTWRRRDSIEMQKIEQELKGDPDLEDHVLELYSFIGAIAWLQFWADKGFKIAADY
jgi:hypothetical protein